MKSSTSAPEHDVIREILTPIWTKEQYNWKHITIITIACVHSRVPPLCLLLFSLIYFPQNNISTNACKYRPKTTRTHYQMQQIHTHRHTHTHMAREGCCHFLDTVRSISCSTPRGSLRLYRCNIISSLKVSLPHTYTRLKDTDREDIGERGELCFNMFSNKVSCCYPELQSARCGSAFRSFPCAHFAVCAVSPGAGWKSRG